MRAQNNNSHTHHGAISTLSTRQGEHDYVFIINTQGGNMSNDNFQCVVNIRAKSD